jgi:hypothetical protein
MKRSDYAKIPLCDEKPRSDTNNKSEGGQKKHPAVKPLLVRVPEEFMTALREEASQDEISVNSLIVNILKKHVEWGRFQEKLGFMPLHKSMIVAMLSKMSPDDVDEIGRLQKDQTVRDFLLLKSGYSLETFVHWIELRCRILGFLFMHRQEQDSLFIMIRHDMGHNWSLYYKGMFSAVLQELLPEAGYNRIVFSTSNSSFSMSVSNVVI